MSERLGAALFRAALFVLPPWLRRRAGPEMLDVFRARHRRSRGTVATARAWLVEFAGLARVAVSARVGGSPRHPPLPSRTMDHLLRDVRFALRAILRRPTTAVLAIVTLALGIGASTAMFSVVDAVLLRPLPYPDPDRIVSVYTTNPSMRGHPTLGDAAERGVFAWPEFVDLRDNADEALESVALLAWGTAIIRGDGPAERIALGATTPELFSRVLRVEPLLGRTFAESDEGFRDRVVLTEAFWERRFGRDPDIVGRTIELGGTREVVGVLPASFEVSGWGGVEAWELMAGDENRGNHSYTVIGRLADGVTPERAAAVLARAFEAAAPPGETHDHGINVFSRHADETRGVRGPLTLLIAASVVLLLVACGNVAVLLLGSAVDRDQEMAVRGALGAGGQRIVGQLLTESLLLAGLGAGLGILLTGLVTDALVLLAPAGVPRIDAAAVDGRALSFAVGAALACGVLFGLAPAWMGVRKDLAAAMGARGGSRAGRSRLQGALVAGELALATVLLVGAGLLGRTVLALNAVETGIDMDRLVAVRAAIPFADLVGDIEGPERSGAVDAVYQRLADRMARIPGVEGVALTNNVPLTGDRANNDVVPEGFEGEPPIAERRFVSHDFFEVSGIRIVEGRAFDPADDRLDAAPTVIVSEGLARLAWPDGRVVGRTLGWWGQESTVIGVAETVRDEGVVQGTDLAFYVPRRQADQLFASFLVRTAGDPTMSVGALRAAVADVDPGIAVASVRPLTEHFAADIAEQRYRARLVLVFSGLAVLFALMGVYGVTSRSVASRTRELGIRMALGAERGTVLGLVLRQGVRLAVYGGVAGLLVSLVATRAVEGYLWGVEPTDPVTLVGTALALGAASVLAALAPGRRAARVDPVEALRSD